MHDGHSGRCDEGEGANHRQDSYYDLGRPAAPANQKDHAGNDQPEHEQGAKPAEAHHPSRHHAHATVHHAGWTAQDPGRCGLTSAGTQARIEWHAPLL